MKSSISFRGKVIRGDNFGKKLGFPTANIDRRDFNKLKIKPKFGVYSGKVILPNVINKKAGLVIGPLDKKGLPKLEAFILNFEGNLYGKEITFILEKFLRPYKTFSNIEKLIEQIKKDIKQIR